MSGFENLKILLVEDNQHMRALLRSLLHALGLRDVRDAANGADALKLLCDTPFDLILTDLAMKPMDGLDFTRQVRNSSQVDNPFVPIIMVTGHTEKHRVVAARDAGITEFIAKPITPQGLFSRIAEIVERPRAFVRTEQYFGPDRRRRTMEDYAGPWRRHDDHRAIAID